MAIALQLDWILLLLTSFYLNVFNPKMTFLEFAISFTPTFHRKSKYDTISAAQKLIFSYFFMLFVFLSRPIFSLNVTSFSCPLSPSSISLRFCSLLTSKFLPNCRSSIITLGRINRQLQLLTNLSLHTLRIHHSRDFRVLLNGRVRTLECQICKVGIQIEWVIANGIRGITAVVDLDHGSASTGFGCGRSRRCPGDELVAMGIGIVAEGDGNGIGSRGVLGGG